MRRQWDLEPLTIYGPFIRPACTLWTLQQNPDSWEGKKDFFEIKHDGDKLVSIRSGSYTYRPRYCRTAMRLISSTWMKWSTLFWAGEQRAYHGIETIISQKSQIFSTGPEEFALLCSGIGNWPEEEVAQMTCKRLENALYPGCKEQAWERLGIFRLGHRVVKVGLGGEVGGSKWASLDRRETFACGHGVDGRPPYGISLYPKLVGPPGPGFHRQLESAHQRHEKRYNLIDVAFNTW